VSNESVAVTKIKLSELGTDSGMELVDLRWDLRQRITVEKLIAATSTEDLLALAREHFDFDGATEDFCKVLLQRFDIIPKTTPEAAVVQKILGLIRLPHDEYEHLIQSALADLKPSRI